MGSRAVVCACVGGLSVAFLYVLGSWTHTIAFIVVALPIALASIAFLTGLITVLKTGVRVRDRVSIVWFGFLLGLTMFSIAQVTWSAYAFRGIQTPTVSESDAFNAVGYFILLLTVLYYVVPFREAISRKVLLITALVGASLIASLLWGAAIVKPGDVSTIFQFFYLLLDILLLVAALPILELVSTGTFWRPFLSMFLGLIFLLAADLVSAWSFFDHGQTYFTGDLWEILYYWGYISVVLGFYLRLEQYRRASL